MGFHPNEIGITETFIGITFRTSIVCMIPVICIKHSHL